MALKVAIRKFKYGSLELADPNPNFTAEQVKEYWAGVYPELTQAAIEGPEQTEEGVIFEFEKAVGTKGVTVIRIAAGDFGEKASKPLLATEDLLVMGKIYIALTAGLHSDGGGRLLPPSEAQGMI